MNLFLVSADWLVEDFKEGKISEDDYCQIKERGCPGFGACPVMGTANTMTCLAEALGM